MDMFEVIAIIPMMGIAVSLAILAWNVVRPVKLPPRLEPLIRLRRRYPLGFKSVVIEPGKVEVVSATPKTMFRLERLYIPSTIAHDVSIVNITVGNQWQMDGSPLPGAMFSEVAEDAGIVFDTAEVDDDISLHVRNDTGHSLPFSASAVGSVVRQ